MPHQCTTCGRAFADGSNEMLSGCPNCGGNKFQYQPKGAVDDSLTDEGSSTAAAESADAESATAAPDSAQSAGPPGEDGAQASARTDVVSKDELEAAAESTAAETPSESSEFTSPPVTEAPDGDEADDEVEPSDPNLDALRQKLNDQFESIRILSPGQYELNLMELYDREEYIISLREDGRYVIEMPEGWDER